MILKDLKIRTQLILGGVTLILLMILLGIVSFIQSSELHKQTEIMYRHPVQVIKALGSLHSDFLYIRNDMKDIVLTGDENEITADLTQIETCQADAQAMLDTLYRQYLGNSYEIDTLKNALIKWNSIRDESMQLLRTGNIEEARMRTRNAGIGGIQAARVYKALLVIENFAKKKSDILFANSNHLADSLNVQLLLLILLIILIETWILLLLIRNIRRPLNDLNDAAVSFHNGNMEARSTYTKNNEFGKLASSFNILTESIQVNMDLNNKVANLAGIMITEDDARMFFQTTLAQLLEHTGGQMAAVYLLSRNKNNFDLFESIGMERNAKSSFSALNFEGEFGNVLVSRRVQYILDAPQDSRFVFNTVTGKFPPREIITIPIIANSEIIAIVSLASINRFRSQAPALIDKILVTLCARTEGVLAYRKIKEFSELLESQNRELESQKSELLSQAAELVEQNAELELQKSKGDESNRLKTIFLSNMSHELRTPLNSVIALSGVLNRRLASKIPEEEYGYLEVIERNGKHLLSLINDILDLSRIESGREETDVSEFDLNVLISNVIGMIYPQAMLKDIALLQKDREEEIIIYSDPGKCRHILQNIIGNAVKFTEKGQVEVSCRQSGDQVWITIADTGIGIPEKSLPFIFDEFRQADGSTSRRYGGTGLGLAIARKYAILLGGDISVQSTPGMGATFTLILPARYQETKTFPERISMEERRERIKPAPKIQVPDKTVKTILLVEDSEPAVIQMKDILEENGYELLVARDGAEALEIIAHTLPDAMILDLMLPGIDGFEVLRIVRETEATSFIPVLILTAKQITKEDLKFLKRNNIHQLIQKGDVNRNELLKAVETMVFPKTTDPSEPVRRPQNITGKPLILVVEDNPDNILTVKALLSDNFKVIEARDGTRAVELAKQALPHLILMDIELPVMNGIDAFHLIREDPATQNIPVIALTASAMVTDRETILSHGFDAYIPKPIDETLFFKLISTVLYG